MSTRCRIAIEDKNGKVRSIYCHHDGYLQGRYSVGQILLNHYKNKAKINALMELGDLSSLGTEPTRFACDCYAPTEALTPAAYVCSESQLVQNFKSSDQDYLYLFKDRKWRYMGYYDNEFKPIPKDEEGEEKNG